MVDLLGLLLEMFSYNDICYRVKATVAETTVRGNLGRHMYGFFGGTTRDDFDFEQRVEDCGDLERKPADDKQKEDCEDQGGGSLLCLDCFELLNVIVFQSLDYSNGTVGNDYERHKKSNCVQQGISNHVPMTMRWVMQIAGRHIVLRHIVYRPEYESRRAQEHCRNPNDEAVPFGTQWSAHPSQGHRFHQGQVAIDAHHHQEINARIQIHMKDAIDGFAKEGPKRPIKVIGYVNGPKR